MPLYCTTERCENKFYCYIWCQRHKWIFNIYSETFKILGKEWKRKWQENTTWKRPKEMTSEWGNLSSAGVDHHISKAKDPHEFTPAKELRQKLRLRHIEEYISGLAPIPSHREHHIKEQFDKNTAKWDLCACENSILKCSLNPLVLARLPVPQALVRFNSFTAPGKGLPINPLQGKGYQCSSIGWSSRSFAHCKVFLCSCGQ